jgi:hypothetical protein
VGCMQVKEWFKQFIEGQTSFENDEHSGSPSTSWDQLMIDSAFCHAR